MKRFSMEIIETVTEHCSSTRDKVSLCSVNWLFYAAASRVLFKHVTIMSPRQYVSFKSTVIKNPHLANLVHRIDLSSYTTRGSRLSEEKAKSLIIASELADMIGDCGQLRELFIGEEMMHSFVSPELIRTLFNQQNKLRTIDFTAFCDRNMVIVLADTVNPLTTNNSKRICHLPSNMEVMQKGNWSIPKRLENISFYMCMALSQDHFFIPFFDKLQQSGNQLKRLDLACTQITNSLFSHVRPASSLTHLNLQGCPSLSCCSPLIEFLVGCGGLVELNLNMDFNGVGGGSRFCHACIARIINNNTELESLDLGGHSNFDDTVLIELQQQQRASLKKLKKISVANCVNISLDVLTQSLLTRLNQLQYINLSRTSLAMDVQGLSRVLEKLSTAVPSLQAIEMNNPLAPNKKYPDRLGKWKLWTQGRRTYYNKEDCNGSVDPRFVFSKKLILADDQTLTPMNKYWCYSY